MKQGVVKKTNKDKHFLEGAYFKRISPKLELENEILKERAVEALSIISESNGYLYALYELVPLLKRYLTVRALVLLSDSSEDIPELDMSLKELFDFANRNIELFEGAE
mgnify:CR=1 FL=1